MHPTLNTHGLVLWSEEQIKFREYANQYIADCLEKYFRSINTAWQFVRFEAPCLLPVEHISKEYSAENYFLTNHKNLGLAPETTASTYYYAKELLQNKKLPLCVWQSRKSFRKEESTGSLKHLRLLEFYQTEFQCLYSNTTKKEYFDEVVSEVKKIISNLFTGGLMVRSIESDRLPSYSKKTMDIEVEYCGLMKEVCSISQRTDFANDIENLEIAIGIDRLVAMKFYIK